MAGDEDPRPMTAEKLADLLERYLDAQQRTAAGLPDRIPPGVLRGGGLAGPGADRGSGMRWDGIVHAEPGGQGGGRSVKPGNIVLNWKDVLFSFPDFLLTAFGVAANPVLLVLAGLSIARRLWLMVEVELSERHALVLWAMWKRHAESLRVPEQEVAGLVAKEAEAYGASGFADAELRRILGELVRLKCIRKADDNDWELCEQVKERRSR